MHATLAAGLAGQNFANSWVDVKGNGWVVRGNTGYNSLGNGLETHVLAAPMSGEIILSHGVVMGGGKRRGGAVAE